MESKPSSLPFNKRTLSYVALNLLGLFIIYLIRDFITPILGAVIFFVLLQPVMNKLVNEKGWKPGVAAVALMLITFVLILIPTFVFSYLLYSKIAEIAVHPESILHLIQLIDEKFLAITGKELFNDNMIRDLQAKAGQLIPEYLGKAFIILGDIGILYFVLYYMLVHREVLNKEINAYLPFELKNIKLLAGELQSQTLSNTIGVPLIALIQGTAAGIGYWIFGLADPVFWGLVTAFASIIPIAGSTLVWAPSSILIMATGNLWMGLGLIAYGVLVVINIDNIARFIIQKKFADVHPLITVFGVIIGLNLFGLPGLIFGPLMLSYFFLLIKIYRNNYTEASKSAVTGV